MDERTVMDIGTYSIECKEIKNEIIKTLQKYLLVFELNVLSDMIKIHI